MAETTSKSSKKKASEAEETEVPILSRLRPPVGAVRRKRRKGRGIGSGLGKTAGKGMKGMKARSTGSFGKLGFEGGQMPLQRRLPKFGFKNIFSKEVATINVEDLARFDAGSTIGLQELKEKGLLKGRYDELKVLGRGEVKGSYTVSAHAFSKSAKEKIELARIHTRLVEA